MARTMEMTQGNPTRLIISFAIPILAGNALQQLYNLVDSLVVGQLLGVTALAAVSASGWLDWTVLSLPMGLAQGFSILAAQHFGARKQDELRHTVAQSYLLSVLIVLLLEITSQLLLHPVLVLMNTPAETIRMTENYLRIIYAGLPLVMALNVFSGFLHALGNSRTPLIALACSSFANMGLDVLFVGPLGLGTNGGALATVSAQGISALICGWTVLHQPELIPARSAFRPDPGRMKHLLRLGLPVALGNLVISIGGLVLQGVVNGFGFLFMAGYNASARLQGLVEIAGGSLGNAVGTFTGQNYGARRMDRVRTGLRRSAQIGFALAVIIGALAVLTGRLLLSLFIADDPEIAEQVMDYAYQFLCFMSAGLPMLYLLFVYRSTLQGLGDTFIPMASGFVELAMRIGAALLLPLILGIWGIYFAEISAWVGAAILLIVCCYRKIRMLSNHDKACAI